MSSIQKANIEMKHKKNNLAMAYITIAFKMDVIMKPSNKTNELAWILLKEFKKWAKPFASR